MRNRITTVFAAFILAISLFAPMTMAHGVNAGGGNCDNGIVAFYGNDNYNPSTHFLFLCKGGSIANFDNFSTGGHGTGSICPGFLGFDDGHWEDCVSSLDIFSGSGVVCIYSDRNYGHTGIWGWITSGQSGDPDLNAIPQYQPFTNANMDDKISSAKYIGLSSNC